MLLYVTCAFSTSHKALATMFIKENMLALFESVTSLKYEGLFSSTTRPIILCITL